MLLVKSIFIWAFSAVVVASNLKCLLEDCKETSEITRLIQNSKIHDRSIYYLRDELNNQADQIFGLSKQISDLQAENGALNEKLGSQSGEIESLKASVSVLLQTVAELTASVESNTEEIGVIQEEIDGLDNKTSMVAIYDMDWNTDPDTQRLPIPAKTCRWVQVSLDMGTSGVHGDAYTLLYANGFPIDGGDNKCEDAYDSISSVGFNKGVGGTSSRTYYVTDTWDEGVTLKLGACYVSNDNFHSRLRALCYA